jgi:hypothetical protein
MMPILNTSSGRESGYAEILLGRRGTRGLAVSIYNAKGHFVKRIYARDQGAQRVELLAGEYAALPHLPVSDVQAIPFTVHSRRTTKVEVLKSRESPNEWLDWATSRRSLRALGEPGPNTKALDDAWVRIWINENGKWQPADGAARQIFAERDCLLYQVALTKDACLQVGGPLVPWRMYRLPVITRYQDPRDPTQHLLVLIAPSAVEGVNQADSLVVTITRNVDPWSDGPQEEIFLEYLLSNEISVLKSIEGDASLTAEELLSGKVANPFGAIIGSYYLLRNNDIPRLHDWTSRLHALYPGVPDTAIILAMHKLRRGEDMAEAAMLLEDAVAVGAPPIYSEGLRLLNEGLQIVQSLFPLRFRPVFNRAERLWTAALWSSPYASYFARKPERPSHVPTFGRPDQPRRLLPKLDEQQRRARRELKAYQLRTSISDPSGTGKDVIFYQGPALPSPPAIGRSIIRYPATGVEPLKQAEDPMKGVITLRKKK